MDNSATVIESGDLAPDFELTSVGGSKIRLSNFRGEKHVVLVFFPFSFTGVCEGELCALQEDYSKFESANSQIIGVSCDSTFAQARWTQDKGFPFPLVSDFWPHGQVSRSYGVFNEKLGCANRTTFIIDQKGLVTGMICSDDIGSPRERADYEAAIAAL